MIAVQYSGFLDQLRIRPSQPSLAGTYVELGNKKIAKGGTPGIFLKNHPMVPPLDMF